MKYGFIKGLKPLFVQRIALLISICYLMNPLHRPMRMMLHSIAHAIEVPDYIMSHSSSSDTSFEIHGHKEHKTNEVHHDHKIIDLVNTFFEASNENESSENPISKEIKIDKHISTFEISFKPLLTINHRHHFENPEKNIMSGFIKKCKEPPKLLSLSPSFEV